MKKRLFVQSAVLAILAAPLVSISGLCRGFPIRNSHSRSQTPTTSSLFASSAVAGIASTLDTSLVSVSSSVTKPHQASTSSLWWSQLAPKLWEDPRGVDVRLTWVPSFLRNDDNPNASARHVAAEFLDQMEDQHGKKILHKTELEDDLSLWIQCFEEVCAKSLHTSRWTALTARVVCNRGPASTKCPRWHLDHVPFRWIQSLVGPGCKWVDPACSADGTSTLPSFLLQSLNERVEAEGGEDLKEEDSESNRTMNAQRVSPEDKAMLRQALSGEAVILLGNGWRDIAVSNHELPPVIHKSPDGIPVWQGRILLTMDVVVEDSSKG